MGLRQSLSVPMDARVALNQNLVANVSPEKHVFEMEVLNERG